MEESIEVNKEEDLVDLPPGFRFHPTDEEIITHYLTPKAVNCSFTSSVIGEIDLNKCEPWDMPSRAKMGEKEWYFFCHRDRKYPTGTRTNRATELGYWKATGKDKEIYKGKGQLVGMKKTLVFYCGRAPKGEKTGWVMHEYRLEGKLLYNLHRSSKDDWVVCRVLHRITGMKKPAPIVPGGVGSAQFDSYTDNDLLDFHSPPPLIDLACSIGPTSLGFNDAVEDNEFKFMKGVDSNMDLSLSSLFVPKSSVGSYFYFPSRGSELQDQMECHSSGYPPMMTMKMMNPTDSHWDPLAPSSFQAPGSTNSSFFHPEQQSRLYCKDEQFSNPNRESMVSLSQDTSRSIDISNTAEISSSKQEKFETLTGQDNSIEDDIADIDCLWDL